MSESRTSERTSGTSWRQWILLGQGWAACMFLFLLIPLGLRNWLFHLVICSVGGLGWAASTRYFVLRRLRSKAL
jgi:hypothetical protein